ncbi:MAG: hypothetical protein PHI23_01115 [Candidatus Peribacteraceae bacterium]|nr:hypothetical protein [Candidatus Peribacteraceae bacterium]
MRKNAFGANGDRKTVLFRACFFLAIVASSLLLLIAFVEQFFGDLVQEAAIYFAVGRGITRGFLPYIDFFESKPPGIFLVSALSILLSHSAAFARLAQLLVIALLPLLVRSGTASISSDLPKRQCSVFFALAFITGSVIAFFTAAFAGGFQVESFGAVFACAYAVLLLRPIASRGRILLASLLIFLALFFKEPFILSVFVLAVLLLPTPRAFLRLYLYPQVLALCWFAIALGLLRVLGAYTTLYLPFMLFKRLAAEPLWLQGLRVERVAITLLDFSWVFALFVLTCMFLPVLLSALRRDRIRKISFTLLRILLAGYLLILAAGTTGNFSGRHLVFAVPMILGFFFLTLRNFMAPDQKPSHWKKMLFPGFAALILLLPIEPLTKEVNHLLSGGKLSGYWLTDEAVARDLDLVLDRCHVERYLYFGISNTSVFGATKHLPLGPLFFLEHYFLEEDRLTYSMLNNMKRAEVVLFKYEEEFPQRKRTPFYNQMFDEMEKNFVTTPPLCAEGLTIDAENYHLLFRKSLLP